MSTVSIIVASALIYVTLLALTLLYFAGASRANERWDEAREIRELRRDPDIDEYRHVA